jgi:hypothetical protein
MRKAFLIAGLAVAIAAPTAVTVTATDAQAKTACERNRSNTRLAGTVGGGILGALAGRTIAGRGDNAEGTIIGGVAGAVAGNQLLKKKGPCPPGYTARYYAPTYAPTRSSSTRSVSSSRVASSAPRCTWQNQAYRDAYGQVINRQVEVCR